MLVLRTLAPETTETTFCQRLTIVGTTGSPQGRFIYQMWKCGGFVCLITFLLISQEWTSKEQQSFHVLLQTDVTRFFLCVFYFPFARFVFVFVWTFFNEQLPGLNLPHTHSWAFSKQPEITVKQLLPTFLSQSSGYRTSQILLTGELPHHSATVMQGQLIQRSCEVHVNVDLQLWMCICSFICLCLSI